jgi:hypothetical protein
MFPSISSPSSWVSDPGYASEAYAPALFDPGFIDNGSSYYSGAPLKSTSSLTLEEVAAASPSASLGGEFFSGLLSYGSTAQELPSQIVSVAPENEPAAASSSGGGSLNPAQQLGKGKNFTGYINGVYYNKGYPAAASSLAAKTETSSSGQAAGGNFFSGQYADPTQQSNASKLINQGVPLGVAGYK